MSAWLEDASGQRHDLGASCVLGRLPECSVLLPGAKVSRRHALVYSMDGAEHSLVDLGSTNGVTVNGYRIQQPHPLRDGDEIRIGDNRLFFRAGGPSPDSHGVPMRWVETARAEPALSALDYGIVLVNAKGEVQFMTARAREWIVVYFPQAAGDRLPDEIQRWLTQRSGLSAGSRPPLIVLRDSRRLAVRLVERGANESILHLTEESPVTVKTLANRLGLTEREAEVLHWIAEGKSNRETAMLLEISVRTVEKHAENAFAKLGVENRNAALRTVMSALGHHTG
jgi:DNA-binding CsgD family transcriptional regulator